MLSDRGNNFYLTDGDMRVKGELSFSGDTLLKGGCQNGMTNGIDYCETRQYRNDSFFIRFYFVTRCFNKKVEDILEDLKKIPPDILIMNSCLWDLSRYGTNGWPAYKEKLKLLFDSLLSTLKPSCLVIWNSTLPVSTDAYGGFLGSKARSQKQKLPADILEANEFVYNLIKDYPFVFLDLHYFLRYHRHRLSKDGIHWDMTAHRRISNLLFTRVSEAWGIPLPGRVPLQFHPCRLDSTKVAGSSDAQLCIHPSLGSIFTGFGKDNQKMSNLMNSFREVSEHVTYRRMHDDILYGRRGRRTNSMSLVSKSKRKVLHMKRCKSLNSGGDGVGKRSKRSKKRKSETK